MPPRLVQNDESWLAFSDLVFVDPVGTGFSRIIEKDARRRTARRRGRRQRAEGRRARPERVLRLQARPRVAVRVHRPLALEQPPLGLAGLHRRRELRRLPRRAPRADPPGDRRDRAERRDPHLAGARDRDARLGGLRRPRLGRPPADDGGRGRAPRPFARVPERHAARRRATRGRGVRDGRLHRLPDARRVDARRRARPRPLAAGGPDRASRRPRRPGRGPRPDQRVRARAPPRRAEGASASTTRRSPSTDPFPDREPFGGPDPTLSGIAPAYTMAINRQLRSEIGVETDREYALLSYEVNKEWKDDDKRHFFAPPAGATDDFRYGMALNPHLKAFITHGQFDLVTPYYASDRLRNLMRLDPAVAGPRNRAALRRRPHVLRVGGEPAGVHGGDRRVLRGGRRRREGSELGRDAVRPLRDVGRLVRPQPRGRAGGAQRGEGRRPVPARAAGGAVPRLRRQRPRRLARRPERALPLGGRPGRVPRALGRVHADRRGRGAAAAAVGLLPLPGGRQPCDRRRGRRAVRDPHARLPARVKELHYLVSEVAAKYGASVAKETESPDEAYADWPGDYQPVRLPPLPGSD